MILLRRERVVHPTVVVYVVAAEAHRTLVIDRQVDGSFELAAILLAETEIRVTLDAVGGGFDGDDADGAGDRVAAEQKTLRSAQCFGALGVEEGGNGCAGVSLVDTVVDDADRRIA